MFLFLASGGSGAGRFYSAERGTDIQLRRERREGEETAFLSEIGMDEMEGRKEGRKERRNVKGKNGRRQKMYLSGAVAFFM